MSTPSTASSTSWPASPTRRQSAKKIIGKRLHSTSSPRRPRRLDGIDVPCAGHHLSRHSSNPAPRRSRPSRATTTSAACPRTCNFELVEPLARSSIKDEVRACRQGPRPARHHGLSVSPSPAPASACAASARSRVTAWRASANPTPSCARNWKRQLEGEVAAISRSFPVQVRRRPRQQAHRSARP